MDEKSEKKSVRVNCSFCGKEIECPEDMLGAKKHACFECFEKLQENLPEEEIENMHVDIPRDKMDEISDNYMINTIMDVTFQRFWKEEKDRLKDMSRKDAVAYAFGSGASSMLGLIKQMDEETERREKSKSNSA